MSPAKPRKPESIRRGTSTPRSEKRVCVGTAIQNYCQLEVNRVSEWRSDATDRSQASGRTWRRRDLSLVYGISPILYVVIGKTKIRKRNQMSVRRVVTNKILSPHEVRNKTCQETKCQEVKRQGTKYQGTKDQEVKRQETK